MKSQGISPETSSKYQDVFSFLSTLSDAPRKAKYLAALADAFHIKHRIRGILRPGDKASDTVGSAADKTPKDYPNEKVAQVFDSMIRSVTDTADRATNLRGTPFDPALKDILEGLHGGTGEGYRDTLKASYEALGKVEDLAARYDKLPKALEDIRSTLKETLSDEGLSGKGAGELTDLHRGLAEFDVAKTYLDKDVADQLLTRAGNIKTEITANTFAKILEDARATGDGSKIATIQRFSDATANLEKQLEAYNGATGRFSPDKDVLREASERTAKSTQSKVNFNEGAQTGETIAGPPQGGGVFGNAAGAVVGAVLGHAAGAAGHTLSHALGGAGLAGAGVYAARKIIPKIFRYALNNPGQAAHVLTALYGISKEAAQVIERSAVHVVASRQFGPARGEVLPGVNTVFRRDTPGLKKAYDKAVQDVLKYANNPNLLISSIHDATGNVAQFAPNTAAAMATTISAAVGYLASKIPQTGQAGAFGAKLDATPAQMAEFLNIKDVVDFPDHIWGILRSGTLTPSSMVGRRFKLFIQITIKKAAMELAVKIQGAFRTPLDGTQSLMASMFLGVDATGALGGSLANQISYMQSVSQMPNQPSGVKRSTSADSALSTANRTAPFSERIAQKP